MRAASMADGRLRGVPSELTRSSIAAPLWFVADDAVVLGRASDGGGDRATDALAVVERVRRERPAAAIAVHVADRERAGVARVRDLCEIGWPGQTLVSAAAAAALGDGRRAARPRRSPAARPLAAGAGVRAGRVGRGAAALIGRHAKQSAYLSDELRRSRGGARRLEAVASRMRGC